MGLGLTSSHVRKEVRHGVQVLRPVRVHHRLGHACGGVGTARSVNAGGKRRKKKIKLPATDVCRCTHLWCQRCSTGRQGGARRRRRIQPRRRHPSASRTWRKSNEKVVH